MRGRVFTFVLCLAGVLVSSRASASFHAVWFRGESSCPATRAVAGAVRNILPDIVIAADAENAFTVEIVEDAHHYRVRVGSAERTYTADDACDERARKAAVFIALVLEPPTVEIPPTPAIVRTRVEVALEASGVFTFAPQRTSLTWLAGGGALGLFFGGKYVGGVVGLEGLSTVTRSFPEVQAHVTRLPVTAGVRARLVRKRLTLSLDVDALLGPLFVRASGTNRPIDSTRLEAGVRLEGRVSYRLARRVSTYFALQADILPRSYALRLPTDLVVDKTPEDWLGVALGVTFDLH